MVTRRRAEVDLQKQKRKDGMKTLTVSGGSPHGGGTRTLLIKQKQAAERRTRSVRRDQRVEHAAARRYRDVM